MDARKALAYEFMLATAINSWGAIKQGYAPWPPVIVASAIAMAVLSLVSAIDDRLAALLGAGFIMASLMAAASGGTNSSNGTAQSFSGIFGAIPQNVSYDTLKLGGSNAQAQNGDQGTQAGN